MLFPYTDDNGPKAATLHPYTLWRQLLVGWSQMSSKVMEKTVSDLSCLWILFCTLCYHRNENRLGSTLQLGNLPATLLWPAYLNSLTLVTWPELHRDECAGILQLLTPERESAFLSMKSFLPFYYLHRNGGTTSTFQKNHTPHEQLGCFETWVWARLYVFFKFPAFGNMNQFRFHLAINLNPYRVLSISVFTMYNNRKACFY